MSFFSALKTLKRAGDAHVVPQPIQTEIERVENLGGKLSSYNAGEIAARAELTPSQIEALFKRLKESEELGTFTEGDYSSWKRFFDENPESRGTITRQEIVASALIGDLLKRTARQNADDNLAFVQEFNRGKPREEQISFFDLYESRDSFPEGFENVVKGYENIDLQGLVKKTPEPPPKQTSSANVDFSSLSPVKKEIPQEGNIINVNFSSLKRKEFEGSFKRYDFSEDSSGKKLEGIDFEILDGDGAVIGAVQAEDMGGGVLQVFHSSLEAPYRGRGVGKEAYTRLIEAARERGFSRVVSDNSVSEDAVRVWESLGAVKGKGRVEEMQRPESLDKKQFYTKDETPLYEITLEEKVDN